MENLLQLSTVNFVCIRPLQQVNLYHKQPMLMLCYDVIVNLFTIPVAVLIGDKICFKIR